MSAQETTMKMVKFEGYDSKSEYPAPDGYRLVKCLYKEIKGKKTGNNSYCFVPDLITEKSVVDNWGELSSIIVQYLQDMQDEKIKEYHRNGGTTFGEQFCSLENLIQWMEEKGKGQRLNGDDIANWYRDHMEQSLVTHYKESMEENKVELISDFICEKLKSLASPKALWTPDEQEKILKLLVHHADGEQVIERRLLKRIAKMAEKESENLLDALGL